MRTSFYVRSGAHDRDWLTEDEAHALRDLLDAT
jgi:hypothetical protein